jgi:hypothetical protein
MSLSSLPLQRPLCKTKDKHFLEEFVRLFEIKLLGFGCNNGKI